MRHRFGLAVPMRFGSHLERGPAPLERLAHDAVGAEGDEQRMSLLLSALQLVQIAALWRKHMERQCLWVRFDRLRKVRPEAPHHRAHAAFADLQANHGFRSEAINNY